MISNFFLESSDDSAGSVFSSPLETSTLGKRIAANLERTAQALDRIQCDIGNDF